jgi:hypothetical protein
MDICGICLSDYILYDLFKIPYSHRCDRCHTLSWSTPYFVLYSSSRNLVRVMCGDSTTVCQISIEPEDLNQYEHQTGVTNGNAGLVYKSGWNTTRDTLLALDIR